MTTVGLKVAQPGKNAKTAQDTDLVFFSLFNTLPIFKVITLEYSLAAGDDIRKTIKHGLNFVPFYLMFYKASSFSDRWIWYPNSGAGILTLGGELVILDRVDKENISFKVEGNGSTAGIVKITIFVFAFPIALSM